MLVQDNQTLIGYFLKWFYLQKSVFQDFLCIEDVATWIMVISDNIYFYWFQFIDIISLNQLIWVLKNAYLLEFH